MKIIKLAFVSMLAGVATGCTTVPSAPQVSMSALPDCFDANYDAERRLFTIKNGAANAANQQCLLTVGPSGNVASASRLSAGIYRVYLVNGGGGGAGGTFQAFERGGGGGGGGGGAGAKESQATVNLTEGVYKLTLGAGGPGGNACAPGLYGPGGGPGWLGSPSNIVRVATGEVILGTPGADTYARPTRRENERRAGEMTGSGGSGPGETSGGAGSHAATAQTAKVEAGAGASKPAAGPSNVAPGGAAGFEPQGKSHLGYGGADREGGGGGGGGGATSVAAGGGGGGETQSGKDLPPVRGSFGSGGGGGEGTSNECEAGAPGGNGFIAFRRN